MQVCESARTFVATSAIEVPRVPKQVSTLDGHTSARATIVDKLRRHARHVQIPNRRVRISVVDAFFITNQLTRSWVAKRDATVRDGIDWIAGFRPEINTRMRRRFVPMYFAVLTRDDAPVRRWITPTQVIARCLKCLLNRLSVRKLRWIPIQWDSGNIRRRLNVRFC